MRAFLQKRYESKRELITYIVIILWFGMGMLGSYFDVSYLDLSVYFLSLTGFIGSYIFGESVRKSEKTSFLLKGPNSRREALSYIVLFLWTLVGVFSIFKNIDLVEMSSYFTSLTPFVGAYILGETYKQEDLKIPNKKESNDQPRKNTSGNYYDNFEQINS